uniref:Uncharacterized protein n=1 Tax=Rhizophora mucronata TaxID=61149 RepID=A0A2P2J020_RHIMU
MCTHLTLCKNATKPHHMHLYVHVYTGTHTHTHTRHIFHDTATKQIIEAIVVAKVNVPT